MTSDTSTPKLLAIMIFLIVALTEVGLFFVTVPTDNKESLNTLIQSLLMVMVAAASFYWGSSVGSRQKDASKVVEAPVVPAVTEVPKA
jgi:hypothetical protein